MGTDLVSTVETNAEEIEDLKTNLNTTMTLAPENQDTCEQVNEHSTLIQANTDNLEILNTKVIFSGRTTKDGFGFLIKLISILVVVWMVRLGFSKLPLLEFTR